MHKIGLSENKDHQPYQQAHDILRQGGLVILPTETVYGVACDPTVPGAMEALYASKGRNDDKPIARLAASMEQVQAEALNWNAGMQAIATAFWPGPLTLIIETAEGFTGYRVPDHPVATGVAHACGHTLALTSANKSGGPDPRTAEEAMQQLSADLVLDGGPTAEKAIPSTVVKIANETIECLREGTLPFHTIEECFSTAIAEATRQKLIVFACTGNTCRSPMAEALFRKHIGPDAGWIVTSAGLYAQDGASASHEAIEVLKEFEIDLSSHRSQLLTTELAEAADMIVTMTVGHRDAILESRPELQHKVFLIKSFGTSTVPADVSDPFGGSTHIYKATRDEIDQALADLILFLRTGQ